MNDNTTVTCSFTVDRRFYNAYKSIVARNGENVKGNLMRYMGCVIKYENADADTIEAINEVERMKNGENKKYYDSFEEIVKEIDNGKE